jgi:hypothetical protein
MALGNTPSKTVALPLVQQLLLGWPLHSYRVAKQLLARYGPPHQASSAALLWNYNDPWEKTIVWRTGSRHTFVTPHWDVIEQRISYKVPAAAVPELAAYSSNIRVDRVRGELAVYCGSEGDNFLLMNLAHKIIIGFMTGAEAKQRHGEIMNGNRLHWPEPYMEELQFTIARPGYGVDESAERQVSVTAA